MQESDLQNQILDYLRREQALGRVVWFVRVNSGAIKAGMRFVRYYLLFLRGKEPLGKGKADVEGMLSGGRYFALEVKRPGRYATDEQRCFLQAVGDGGGIAAVVRGIDDVKRAFAAW